MAKTFFYQREGCLHRCGVTWNIKFLWTMITHILDNPLHENNTAWFKVKRALCHSELQTMEVECIVLNSNNSATRALSSSLVTWFIVSSHNMMFLFSHVQHGHCTKLSQGFPEQSQPMAYGFILVSCLFCSCCNTCTSERWSHKTTLVFPCCCIVRWIIQQTCCLHFYLRFGTWLTD